MFSTALDILRIRQYFNAITMTRELVGGVRSDVAFLDTVRHCVLPLPLDHRGTDERHPFDGVRAAPPRGLRQLNGRRVAVVASGGSGALASLVGVARALEDADVRPSVYSLCSGSALFGFPLAAGMTADEVATFVLGMKPDRFVDVDWGRLASLRPSAARGFSGVIRGESLEATYREVFGHMTLADLAVPAYIPVWNVEHNRVEFVGPRTHPRLEVARAVHMATALPLFFSAVTLARQHYYDGGTVDILPVTPVLDIEPVPDAAIVVNCFYPAGLRGEDKSGWTRRAGSIFLAAEQVRTSQHLELARQHLARLRATVPSVHLIEPVPYKTVSGIGLYEQFVDNCEWPAFMRAGRRATLHSFEDDRTLLRAAGPAAPRRPRAQRARVHTHA